MRRLVAWVLIVSLAVDIRMLSAAFAQDPASAPGQKTGGHGTASPKPKVDAQLEASKRAMQGMGGGCESTCKHYKAAFKAVIDNKCKNAPHASPSSAPAGQPTASASISPPMSDPQAGADGDPVYGSSPKPQTYEECLAAFRAEWGELGQHCDAAELSGDGADMELLSAVAYTATAAACGAACFTTWAFDALEPACVIASTASTFLDISLQMKLMIDGESFQRWSQALTEMSSTAIGVVGTVTTGALQVTKGFATDGVKKAASEIGKEAAKKAVEDGAKEGATEGAKEAAKDGGKKAGEEATKEATEKGSDQNTACLAFGFATVVAGMKWFAYAQARGDADTECTRAKRLGSSAAATDANDKTAMADKNPDGGPRQQQEAAAKDLYGSGGLTSPFGSSVSDKLKESPPSKFPGDMLGSAATADPATKLFDYMPNKGQIPGALKEVGSSLADLAKRLEDKSPAQVLAAMAPAEAGDFKSDMAKLDQAIRDGKITGMGSEIPSAAFAGGGGGGFGGGGDGGAARAMKSLFGDDEKKQNGPALASFRGEAPDDDIWHAKYKGSIFDVVSFRTSKALDRVERLDYDLPLNREYSRLPLDKIRKR